MQRNRTATAIAIILSLTFVISLVALPAANAQAVRTKKTHAFIGAVPNPVAVGESVLLHVGITDYLLDVNAGWEGLTVTVTKPDGTTQTLGPIRTDSTGGTGVSYVPSTVGTYYVQTHFPQQDYNWTAPPIFDPEFVGVIRYLASDSEKLALVVQEEPLLQYPSQPLPTEFWTRPIDAQLRSWSPLAGNWPDAPRNFYAPYNEGPETPHIIWAEPLTGTAGSALGGGLIGGEFGDHSYESGDAYEGFFLSSSVLGARWPVIMGGMLFFNRYKNDGLTMVEQEVVALDLHTGRELWRRNWNNTRLELGQIFFWDFFNYHAGFAYLWSVSGTTWNAYEAASGRWVFRINNVPTGTRVYGPNGEIIIYNINLANGWMTKWNSTRVVTETRRAGPLGSGNQAMGSWIREYMGTALNGTIGLQWNVTIPKGLPGAVWTAITDDMVVGNTALGWEDIGESPIVLWALNLKPGQEGLLLYNTTWPKPVGDIAMRLGAVSPQDRVFTLYNKEDRQLHGFNLDTGGHMWGPTESMDYRGIYGMTQNIAYGKVLVTADFGGQVAAFDDKTGEKLWDYVATDPFATDTFIKEVGGTSWALQTLFITDGKLYLGQSEHSPYNPLPRGAPFIALDVETGEEVFRVNGLFRQTRWGGRAAIGDSIIATMDTYNQMLYGVGKGPSAVTVAASPEITTKGSSVLIKGMVLDTSAGATDSALAARFPNGVAAVSDESMGDWMLYVYKQFQRPMNTTGVEVTLSVLDSNGNFREIGKATSDSNGFYSLQWTPDITGKYTLYASFAGSKSYWPSNAETAFAVDPAPQPPTTEEPQQPQPMTDTYVLGIGAAIIIAIAVVGAIILLTLRKRP
jgi:outer membrane protein assembly factor BamB